MDPNERLNGIADALNSILPESVVLVEGRKDVAALRSLGVKSDVFTVQVSGGPMRAAEFLWESGKTAVILTDWDSRGNRLAEDLVKSMDSLGVHYDVRIREKISLLARPYCKDVESLDSVMALLKSKTDLHPDI